MQGGKKMNKDIYDIFSSQSSYTTESADKENTLTMEVFKEAIDKIGLPPAIPEIWYSKYLEPDSIYEFNKNSLSLLLPPDIIMFVGKNIAIEMINQGIEIQNKGVVMAEYEEIDLEVIFTTDDAILLTDSDIEGWIPKSCIQNIDELPKSMDKGDSYTFEIATYQLKDKGFI